MALTQRAEGGRDGSEVYEYDKFARVRDLQNGELLKQKVRCCISYTVLTHT